MKKKNNYIFILILLFIGIGFAYLSTNLSINGRGLFGKSTWSVYFDRVHVIEGEEFVTLAPDLSTNNKEINFEVNLLKPGDAYKFTVDVVNAGDLDAMINLITSSSLTTEQSKYVDFSVTYADGVELEEKNLLKANEHDIILVKMSYKKDIDLDTLRSDKDPVNVSISLEYTQADKSVKEREYHITKFLDGPTLSKQLSVLFGKSYINYYDSWESLKEEFQNDPYKDYSTYIGEGMLLNYVPTANVCKIHYVGGHSEGNFSREYEEKDVSFCESYGESFLVSENNGENAYYDYSRWKTITSINIVDSMTEDNLLDIMIISSPDSYYPIYTWIDNSKLYIYSESDILFLNEDASYSFSFFVSEGDVKFEGLESIYSDYSTNFSYLFFGSFFNNLDLSSFNTSNVTVMNSMFENNIYLKKINCSNWNTKNVVDMTRLFVNCRELTDFDVSLWNVGNVRSISGMFANCIELVNLNIEDWNVQNVSKMFATFSGCFKLTELDLSSWNTANLENLDNTFSDCYALVNLNLSDWNTSNVTTMREMFVFCQQLTNLNLENWDTSNVETFFGMFSDMEQLAVLDLSSFSLDSATDIDDMFRLMCALETIYIGDGFYSDLLNEEIYLFDDCPLLVGGSGTTYQEYEASGFSSSFNVADGYRYDKSQHKWVPDSNSKGLFTLKV